MIIIIMFNHHILALKMIYNVFTISRKNTKTSFGLKFTIKQLEIVKPGEINKKQFIKNHTKPKKKSSTKNNIQLLEDVTFAIRMVLGKKASLKTLSSIFIHLFIY